MRRRQAADAEGGEGGALEHHAGQSERLGNRKSYIGPLLAGALMVLVMKMQPPTTQTILNSYVNEPIVPDASFAVDKSNDTVTTEMQTRNESIIPDVSVVGKSNGTVTPEMQTHDVGVINKTVIPEVRTREPKPMIPRRLIFTYKYNLFAPTPDIFPSATEDMLKANVEETVKLYTQYWNSSDQELKSKGEMVNEEEVVVSFLSDSNCLDLIAKVEPRLVQYYTRERKGEYKADICRFAELYLHGGYYFDIDIKVIEPPHLESFEIPPIVPDPLWQLRQMSKGMKNGTTPTEDDIVTFSTVYDRYGKFFQAFTAATPRHPLLNKTFEYMVAYYEDRLEEVLPEFIVEVHKKHDTEPFSSRRRPAGNNVGPYTLSLAYRSTTNDEWEEYVESMIKNQQNSSHSEFKRSYEDIPAYRRYSRFLYQISLLNEEVKKLGYFENVRRQDEEYSRKKDRCNYVCFHGDQAYFYAWGAGSKACPLEKKFDDKSF